MHFDLKQLFAAIFLLVASGSPGCGPAAAPPTTSAPPTASSPSADGFVLKADVADAKGVKDTRTEAQHEDDVAVFGRIGGDAKPWVEGQAAFLIVDCALEPCADDEGCPTPWDYCCSADELPDNKALVKFVDATGKTLATDARQLFGLKELQTVVVRGKAKRDEAGNLTVLASGIFVRR